MRGTRMCIRFVVTWSTILLGQKNCPPMLYSLKGRDSLIAVIQKCNANNAIRPRAAVQVAGGPVVGSMSSTVKQSLGAYTQGQIVGHGGRITRYWQLAALAYIPDNLVVTFRSY